MNLYTFRSERDDPSGKRDRAKARAGLKQSFKPLGTLTSIADLNKKQSAGGRWVMQCLLYPFSVHCVPCCACVLFRLSVPSLLLWG